MSVSPDYFAGDPQGILAGGTRRRALPRALVLMLYGTIALFYAGSVYDHRLASLLWYAKWLPLVGVLLLTIRFSVKGYPRLRGGGLIWGATVLLLFLLSLNLFVTLDLDRSVKLYLSLVLVILTAQLFANILSSTKARKQFFDVIANVGRVVIASSFIMWLLGISLGRGVGRFSAWTDNPNTLALMLAPTMVILTAGIVERRWQWLQMDSLLLLAGLTVLLATGSRASILWFSVSIFSLWMVRGGLGVRFFIGVFSLIVMLGWWDDITHLVVSLAHHHGTSLDSDVLSGRSEVWSYAAQIIPDHPLLGYGLGSSKGLIGDVGYYLREHQGEHFHNSYLEAVVETGFVGASMFIIMVLYALYRGFANMSHAYLRYGSDWPTISLPWVLLVGACAHGAFETWMLSAGNANTLLFWICVWLVISDGRGVKLSLG